MNVMPSRSICEIQDRVCSERREKQTENRVRGGFAGVCCGGQGLPGVTERDLTRRLEKELFWVLHASTELGVRSCFHYEGFWQRRSW